MSARSLHGGSLVLRDLEITDELKVDDVTISNLDVSDNLTTDKHMVPMV